MMRIRPGRGELPSHGETGIHARLLQRDNCQRRRRGFPVSPGNE